MQIFKDTKDRAWELHIDVTVRDRVKATLDGLDLFGLILNKMEPLGELFGEPARFIELLWVLCESQAAAKQITPEEFGSSIYGDQLGEAADRFAEALLDFFPKRQREAMGRALAANKATGEAVVEEALKKLEALDPQERARKIVEELERRPSRLSRSQRRKSKS